MSEALCASLSMILMMPSAYAASLPGDSADGKRLYDANCMGCHDTAIHTRKDRIVQSLDALEKRVLSLPLRRIGRPSSLSAGDFTQQHRQSLGTERPALQF